MKAEIIIVGEEIISGCTLDTNSAYIGRRLAEIGVEVTCKTAVGDRADDIQAAILSSWNRSPITICTGGLGPTVDDITKKAICSAFDRKLVFQDSILRNLEEKYRERNLRMPAVAQNQALQPQGAELLSNPIGSAPGIVFQDDEHYFVALPGVPSEMEAILELSVIPSLKRRAGRTCIEVRRIRTTGITESEIAELLTDLECSQDRLRLAYLPGFRGIDLRVIGKSIDEAEAKSEVDKLTEAIVGRICEYVYAIGDQSLAEVVGALLKAGGKRVATAESCTGGLIATMLTEVPGSSVFFVGSVVAYDNDVKVRTLNVPSELLEKHGAVSSQVAEAMANGVRQLTGADFGLSVTGIAGPSGGTAEKPVGLVYIGCADTSGTTTKKLNLFGTRQRIRERSATTALDLLRRRLIGIQ